jgi:hypothetical protein
MHNVYEKLCAMNTAVRKHELFDTENATRLACKGDMLPHYNSTRGITLFRTDKRNDYGGNNFFFLHWTNWQNEQSHLTSCTEEQAFQFLYNLYGSRYTDITDEELDYMLNQYFPKRTIADTEEGQQEEQCD